MPVDYYITVQIRLQITGFDPQTSNFPSKIGLDQATNPSKQPIAAMVIMSTGFSFFSMGLYTPPPSSLFLQMLETAETTVEEVVGCEETLTQAKRGCQPLLQLYALASFTQERLEALVSLLLCDPPPNCSYDRGHKYPFVACELLSPAVPEVLEKLLSCPLALSSLLSFPDLPVTNLTTVAYFCTTLTGLLSKGPKQMYELVYQDNKLPLALVRNIHSRSIADLLLTLLSLDPAVNAHFLSERSEVIRALLRTIGLGEDRAEVANSAMILCELITDTGAKSWKLLISALVQQVELEALFEAINAAEVSAVAALRVLNALLACESLSEICQINLPKVLAIVNSSIPPPEFPIEDVESALCPLLLSHLPSICSKLQGDFPIVGPIRMQICELLDLLLRQQSSAYEAEVIQAKGLQYATEIFFKCPQNSIFQLKYENLVETIVEKAAISVQRHLIEDIGLPLQLANACKEAKTANSGLGNMGYITQIAAFLKEKAGEMSWWQGQAHWQCYLEGYLAVETEIESRDIASNSNAYTSNQSEEEDDEDSCTIHFTDLVDPNPVLSEPIPHKSQCSSFPLSHFSPFLYWSIPLATQDLQELD